MRPAQHAREDEPRPQVASTLLRGLTVLERVALADDRGLGVTDLAGLAGLEKSTASRVLATLRVAGYVRQDAQRRYHLTSKLARLAAGYSGSRDVATVARPALARLHRTYDEEIHLAVVNGGAMSFIDYVSSSQPVRSNLPTVPSPIHRLAVGIAVLADLGHEERAELLQQSLRETGERNTAAVRKRLARMISEAQERGWASYDAGDDVTRIACAFAGPAGQPVGAVCLSGPSYRMREIVDRASVDVRETAQAISAGLGIDHPAASH